MSELVRQKHRRSWSFDSGMLATRKTHGTALAPGLPGSGLRRTEERCWLVVRVRSCSIFHCTPPHGTWISQHGLASPSRGNVECVGESDLQLTPVVRRENAGVSFTPCLWITLSESLFPFSSALLLRLLLLLLLLLLSGHFPKGRRRRPSAESEKEEKGNVGGNKSKRRSWTHLVPSGGHQLFGFSGKRKCFFFCCELLNSTGK